MLKGHVYCLVQCIFLTTYSTDPFRGVQRILLRNISIKSFYDIKIRPNNKKKFIVYKQYCIKNNANFFHEQSILPHTFKPQKYLGTLKHCSPKCSSRLVAFRKIFHLL